MRATMLSSWPGPNIGGWAKAGTSNPVTHARVSALVLKIPFASRIGLFSFRSILRKKTILEEASFPGLRESQIKIRQRRRQHSERSLVTMKPDVLILRQNAEWFHLPILARKHQGR